jgi:hypothetical protein
MRAVSGHEIVGHRLVSHLAPAAMVALWGKATSRIVKYGFTIEYRDLDAPRTGIFDGLRIVIDPDVGFEMQCFIVLHLFGHSVQWIAPSLEASLHDLQHTQDRARFMTVLHAYEFEAARYALQLVHEAGVTDLDQWYGDFVETDWRYVEGFYRTGTLPRWEDCIVDDCPLVEAAPIPPLRHRRVEVRFAF